MSSQATRRPRRVRGQQQLALIGGMLVLIVALLAYLWVRERRARMTARREIIRLRRRLEMSERSAALAQMLLKSKGGLGPWPATQPATQPASRPAGE